MSKFINVTVSTSLSTDFYLEVPDNASEEEIRELAKKEVILPHTYPLMEIKCKRRTWSSQI